MQLTPKKQPTKSQLIDNQLAQLTPFKFKVLNQLALDLFNQTTPHERNVLLDREYLTFNVEQAPHQIRDALRFLKAQKRILKLTT